MVVRPLKFDRYVEACKKLAMLIGACAGAWVFWALLVPSSPLKETLLDPERLTSREAALAEADRLADDWIVRKILIDGLTYMPNQDVREVITRVVAMRTVSVSGCSVGISSDATEFDLQFAIEIVERSGKGKLCVPRKAAVFEGYTWKQARVRGIKISSVIKVQ